MHVLYYMKSQWLVYWVRNFQLQANCCRLPLFYVAAFQGKMFCCELLAA